MKSQIRERHFRRLQELLALESQAEAEASAAEKEQKSAEELADAGIALLGLVITDERSGLGGRLILELALERRGPLPYSRFDTGAPVLFSSGEKTERGIVVRKYESAIEIAVEDRSESPDPEAVYRLDRAHDAASIDRQKKALSAAAAAERNRLAEIVSVLVDGKAPNFDERVTELEYFDRSLNSSQQEAVRFAVSANDVALIHGPPGTGKTSTLIEIIRQAVARKQKVLACAPSNLAADNLLERLVAAGEDVVRIGHPARVTPALVEHTLDLMVENHRDVAAARKLLRDAVAMFRKADRWTRAKPEPGAKAALRREAKALMNDARRLEDQAAERILDHADIVVATTSIDARVLGDRRFGLVVIDEACQSTEAGCWVPLLRAERVVLAGDHRQLPPTIVSVEAAREGFGVSLFERLVEEHGEEVVRLLDVQYRMNREIMQFPSDELYEGKLIAADLVKDHVLADLPGVVASELTNTPLMWIDTSGAGYSEELEPGGASRRNLEEAELVLRQVAALREANVEAAAIAVITPYAAQVRLLRGLAAERGSTGVEIDTVDGFQGREKEAIIISLVRSSEDKEIGFLRDIRRMNVALTRARRKLIVIGDGATLSAEKFYARLFEYFERCGAYRTVWEMMS